MIQDDPLMKERKRDNVNDKKKFFRIPNSIIPTYLLGLIEATMPTYECT